MQTVPDDLFNTVVEEKEVKEPAKDPDISFLDKDVQMMYFRLSEDAKDLLRSLMFLTAYD